MLCCCGIALVYCLCVVVLLCCCVVVLLDGCVVDVLMCLFWLSWWLVVLLL